jgi:hypothetical protein
MPEGTPLSPVVLPGELLCRRCGILAIPRVSPGQGQHAARADCAHCGAYIKWLPKWSHDERVARREQFRREAMAQRPPSTAQVAYLLALEDRQPTPGTMQEASERIDHQKAPRGPGIHAGDG